MDGSARDFSDDLACDYHLLFADWSDAIARQGQVLDRRAWPSWPLPSSR